MRKRENTISLWKNKIVQSLLPLLPWKNLDHFYLEKKARLHQVRLVHRKNCDLLPEKQGRIELGISSEGEILSKAKSYTPYVQCCKYCVKKQ